MLKERTVIIDEMRKDGKLLFQLGIEGDKRMLVIKHKGCKRIYNIPFDEIDNAFAKRNC